MRTMTRTATNGRSVGEPSVNLAGFMSPTGIFYSYDVRRLGQRLMYSITFAADYDTASIYDGEDFERSFELFTELGLAINGLNYAEQIAKKKQSIEMNANALLEKPVDYGLKVQPLFLGDSQLPVC